jgi:tetratricopeptide (TPR) repeat protein
MVDKASISKNAQKYLAKGQIDKAIAEWRKLADVSPDGNVLNFIGDLYIKKGEKAPALAEFRKAAKIYMNEGFTLKALAIYKKILNVNPRAADALIALGQLTEEKNIFTDAVKYYLAAADVLSKENKRDELLKVYERVLNLAPTNVQLKTKVAELFSKEGFVSEAAREYLNIGQIHLDKGDAEKGGKFIHRAMEIQPNNVDAIVAMSRLAESSGDMAKAEEHLSSALQKAGESTGLLKRKAELRMASGDRQGAIDVIRTLVEKNPSDVGARKHLGDLYRQAGSREEAWGQFRTIIETLIKEQEVAEAQELLEEFKDLEPVENRRRLVDLYKKAGDERAAGELLGLASLHEKEGRMEQAIACLKEAEGLRPDDAEIKKMMAALQSGAGEKPKETPQKPEETPAAAQPEDEAGDGGASLDIASAQADLEALSGLGAEDVQPEEKPGPPPSAHQPAKSLEEAFMEADIFFKYGLLNEARNLLEGWKAKAPESVELHEKLKHLYEKMNDSEQLVGECIILSTLLARQGKEAESRAYLEEARRAGPSDPRLNGGPQEAEGPEMLTADATGDIGEEFAPQKEADSPEAYAEKISEGDFYLGQGFYAEAAGVYRSLLEKIPDNEDLRKKLGEAERKMQEEHSSPAPAGEEYDMEAVASGEQPDAQAQEPALDDNVMEIFDEFKKGLEQEIEAEDAETHYNLGIAYKEMGLVDDAIKEFQASQHDPDYLSQSATMLGACYMQKGLYALAIESFGTALMKVDQADEASWSLKYDLALAHEQNGDAAQALDLFTEVYGWNADFRDVAEKVNALKTAAEKAQPKGKKNRVSYI